MSRPQKIIPPIKGGFNNILASIAMGSGVGKQTAIKLTKSKTAAQAKPAQKIPPKP